MTSIATYLGDGVYASFDGYQIWLHVENSESGDKWRIALEPDVFRKLVEYATEKGFK